MTLDASLADFGALQAWMQNAILSDDAAGARERVVESNRMTAAARVGVYARGYALRLIECLRSEYPALRAWVGDQVFDLFALGYIRATPSHSYTLYDYGAGFADHLWATRPPEAAADGLESAPAALARVERARAECARARGLEREAPAAANPAAIDPALTLLPGMASRFSLPDSVRLLRVDFDVAAMIAAADDGRRPAAPAYRPCCYAVARRQWRLSVHPLTPGRMAWLEGLAAAGGDPFRAAALASEAGGESADALLADLFVWLPAAASLGIVRREA